MAAAMAEGETVFADLKELRVKESDRIAALARELGRAGVRVAERPDGLIVTGVAGDQGALAGGTVAPMHDHRIAMAGAVLGLVAGDETVIPAAEIATSFPTFAETLRGLGATGINHRSRSMKIMPCTSIFNVTRYGVDLRT